MRVYTHLRTKTRMRTIQLLYNKRQIQVSEALIIVGCLVLLFGVAGFAIDLLPVDAFQPSSNDFYLKIAPTDESSFDWATNLGCRH
ncbi:hypothetical protein TUM17378_32240 [Shewanella algae]|nr:hypothetical protein TUM17378_32240 [Shewanella algae]